MPTQNGTPTDSWSLVTTGGTNGSKGGVSCQYADIEIATTSGATAPAASTEGHPVLARKTEPVELSANHRLWWRLLPNTRAGTSDGAPVGVYTIEDQ